jgi:hypothetical protein
MQTFENSLAFARILRRNCEAWSPRGSQGLSEQLHLVDYNVLTSMNRNYPAAHPMLVDVDLKEGYPDGSA